MSRKIRVIAAAAILMCFTGASCEVDNSNGTSCLPADCAAACEALGYPGGACAEDACVCGNPDTDTYTWDDDAGAEPDASAVAAGDLG